MKDSKAKALKLLNQWRTKESDEVIAVKLREKAKETDRLAPGFVGSEVVSNSGGTLKFERRGHY